MQRIKQVLCAMACCAILAAPVAAQISSPWAFTQDVARVEGAQQAMSFFAAESLDLSLWARRSGRAMDFSDPGLRFLWEITAQSNAGVIGVCHGVTNRRGEGASVRRGCGVCAAARGGSMGP